MHSMELARGRNRQTPEFPLRAVANQSPILTSRKNSVEVPAGFTPAGYSECLPLFSSTGFSLCGFLRPGANQNRTGESPCHSKSSKWSRNPTQYAGNAEHIHQALV